ncbi:MAG: RHS repeat-associated core domain-containing protein [Aquisalimonadaceae bacterium]
MQRTAAPTRRLALGALAVLLTLPGAASGFILPPETTPAARTWSYTYHPERDGVPGRLASVTGPRTDLDATTHYAYDANGNLTQVTNALGHTTTISDHDALGRPRTLTDPNGTVTTLDYDARGRLASRTTDGATTAYSYDGVGNLTGVRLPNGATTGYHYDAARRLIGIEDHDGNRLEHRLDAAGNRLETRIHDHYGQLRYQHQRVYDELNRLRQHIGAHGQTRHYHYDPNGNLTETLDANANPTAHAYDALNRLIETVDADAGRTTYGYAAEGPLAEITDPRGNTTRYSHNGHHALLRLDSPDTDETSFAHDAAGNITRRTDADGRITEYSYDALDRLTAIHDPDDPTRDATLRYDQTYARNGIGRLTTVIDASGITNYHYTPRGAVSVEARTIGGQRLRVHYTYNAADQLTLITYPSGAIVRYSRDAAGQVRRVFLTRDGTRHTLAEHISHAPFGPLTAFTYGNGLAHSRSHTLDYQLDALTSGPVWRSYGLDAAGNITTISDHDHSAESQDFSYDRLHRLTDALGGYGARDYRYDALGNRLSRTDNAATTTYHIAPSSNRLLGIDATELHYDARGNLVRRGEFTFSYDGANRLRDVHRHSELVGRYTYNVHHQRTRKETAAGTVHFLYDTRGQLIAEIDAGGTVLREYIWLGALPLALHQPASGALHYYHTDRLNTPQALTDRDGALAWAAHYRPFGAAEVHTEQVTNPLRFPGQYHDEETGLHYNWHRYYDPETGRYITSDPIGLEGGLNTYAYVLNNPVNFIDPNGLVTIIFQANVRIPGWLSRFGRNRGWWSTSVHGASFGIAESFPFFDGAERDSGIMLGFNVGGEDVGIGSVNMTVGLSRGSVCDLADNNAEVNLTVPGLSGGLDFSDDSLQGVRLGVGAGLNGGIGVQLTPVWSLNHGLLTP